jgi:type I restriction enzyme M protein
MFGQGGNQASSRSGQVKDDASLSVVDRSIPEVPAHCGTRVARPRGGPLARRKITEVYTLPPGTLAAEVSTSVAQSATQGDRAVANERTTEDFVRQHLKTHGVRGQRVEEQTSAVPAIKRALAAASKSGAGAGKPEFIVTFPQDAPKLVVVFECKADPARHESADHNRPADFAVDGVLHYAEHLSKQFDVIGIAVSGTDFEHLRVSTFRQLKGTAPAEALPSPSGNVDRLIPVADYIELLRYDPAVRARTHAELIAFSRVLHNYMRDYAKLSEQEKPLVVSGILLALRDQAFNRNWDDYGPQHLARELYAAIERTVKDADFREEKREIMLQPYSFTLTHPELSKPGLDGETPLRRLIGDIDEHVRPFPPHIS